MEDGVVGEVKCPDLVDDSELRGEKIGSIVLGPDAESFVEGRDNWARAWARNAVRTALVLFTVQVSIAVPHFALLTGMTKIDVNCRYQRV
jgi:hypothetical protein